MSYPSHADYDLAVRYIGRFVFDSVLKTGTPRSRNRVAVGKGGEPLCYPGGFAKVYVVDCGAKTYALRVWLHEISDAAQRYSATTQFFKSHPLPYFVEHFEFVAGGILVQGKRYPILRMEWIEGYSLREFIKLNLNQAALLRVAGDSFAAMVAELHTKCVAHGDLQSENLLLRASNGTVHYKLIDYDTLVVPALMGQPTASTGLASYQHPNRAASIIATEKDDYFSELVIYTCLYALSHDPHLWAEFPANGRDKELLFEGADFTGSVPSPLFQRLYRIGGHVGHLAVVLWNFSRCPNIQFLLPLEKVIELITQPAASSGGGAPSGRKRSPFDELLKTKLNERQSANDGLPNGWLDESAFHARQERHKTSKRTSQRQSSPPLPKQPVANGASTACSTVSAESFQDILARMQTAPIAPPPPPSKSTSGSGTTAVVIIGIFVVLVMISTCQDNSSRTPLAPIRENGSPMGEKKRGEPQVPRASTREENIPAMEEKHVEMDVPLLTEQRVTSLRNEQQKAETQKQARESAREGDIPKIEEKHVEMEAPKPPEQPVVQPTIEQQKAENRKQAQEQFKMGWKYGQSEGFPAAVLAYRTAIELDPEFALAWHNLGWAYAKLGNSADAIVAYEKAVELKPDLQDAWYNLAITCAGINEVEKASRAIVHLRTLNSDRAQALTRQFSSDFVQQLAMAEYPSLGVAKSPLNRKFIARYRRYKASNSTCFDYSDWPIIIAREAARAIGEQ